VGCGDKLGRFSNENILEDIATLIMATATGYA